MSVDMVMDEALEAAVLSRQVHACLTEGQTPRAKLLVDAWRQRAPSAAAPRALQGLLEMVEGKLDQAQAWVQEALDMDRQCPQAYAVMAQVHSAGGRNDEALLCAQTALRLRPEAVENTQLLAQLQLQAGQLAQAEATLRQALTQGTANVAIRLMLVEVLLRGSQAADEGQEILQPMLKSDAHRAPVWALHALALTLKGDIPEARKALRLALALDPDHPIYLLELASLCLHETKPTSAVLAEAQGVATKLQTLNPKEWRASLVLAEVLKRQRQFVHAMKVLSQAAQTHGDCAELWFEFARICAVVGQAKAATEALDKAQALQMPEPVVQAARLDLALRQNDFERAWAAVEATDALDRANQTRCPPLVGHGADGHQNVVMRVLARGIDDLLMYVRYLGALADAGVEVQLWAPDFMASLVQRVRGVARVVNHASDRQANYIEPLARVPVLLGCMDPAPTALPYLSADPVVVGGVRMRRATYGDRPVMLLDLGREGEMDASLLLSLGQWLQKHHVSLILLRPLPVAWESLDLSFEVLDEEDMEQLAAWVMVADGVVCGDVPLSHLVGGMGAQAHVVLPVVHAAVWGVEGTSCAWYPSLSLYRESLQSGWGEAWPRLVAGLNTLLAKRAGPEDGHAH